VDGRTLAEDAVGEVAVQRFVVGGEAPVQLRDRCAGPRSLP
jgi:hypothetical protein